LQVAVFDRIAEAEHHREHPAEHGHHDRGVGAPEGGVAQGDESRR
jgi:hypothetical protein